MTIYNPGDHGFGPDPRNPPPVRYGVLARRHPGSVGPALSWVQDDERRLLMFDSITEARREANLLNAEERSPALRYEGARIGAL